MSLLEITYRNNNNSEVDISPKIQSFISELKAIASYDAGIFISNDFEAYKTLDMPISVMDSCKLSLSIFYQYKGLPENFDFQATKNTLETLHRTAIDIAVRKFGLHVISMPESFTYSCNSTDLISYVVPNEKVLFSIHKIVEKS